jgi:mRNA-degrading endonuclease HigB of HigAB toxin-antitoxin module
MASRNKYQLIAVVDYALQSVSIEYVCVHIRALGGDYYEDRR